MDNLDHLRLLRIESWQIKELLWQQGFLTFNWWFIAITIAIAYIVWWKLADKKRIIELLLFGSFIAVTRVIFDVWGITSGRWTYVIDLVPLGISLFLNDLTIIPLILMLVYQFYPAWSKFLLSLLAVQSAFSFALLPLLSYLGILVIYNWHYAYTFIFMIITATIMKAIMALGHNVQRNAAHEYSGTSAGMIPQPALKPENKDDEV